ncbi:Fic family protein [Mannheimia indoligenes]|uniref:Fic family protein n=1 Tax=Mannheimia indoligenes TaxID=3103145 RepID=A0ABU7ZCC8_9PAST
MEPKFTINHKIVNYIVDISSLVGRLSLEKRDLHLRKEQRIRSIQSSLAIESNPLTLEQVTGILNGKRILAHKLLTQDLIKESGKFRNREVAVYSGENIVHIGAKADFVPKLVQNLLKWAEKSEVHTLIKSCIVHFELEIIHPFADGNGRIGRLWQSLILSQWDSLFEWLPIETIVYQHQQRYYQALNSSNIKNDSTDFIEFMLEAILTTLNAYSINKMSDKMSDKISDKEQLIFQRIKSYLSENAMITNQKAVQLLELSPATARRYLAKFVKLGLLTAQGENKNRIYYIE